MTELPISQQEFAAQLVISQNARDLNEGNTRHQIIDVIIHDVLAWPRNAVECEAFIDPGYSDYVLKNAQKKPAIMIEAKKEGVYFALPHGFSRDAVGRHIPIKTLISDPTVKSAIEQVRQYCLEEGCEYAAIVNGHEWVFFRTFGKNVKWKDSQAFVVSHLRYFAESFTEAVNYFGYSAIVERGSLVAILSSTFPENRDVFYVKDKIISYNHEVTSNRFASLIRPLSERYLGVISENDLDLMSKCYVNQRDFVENQKGVLSIIYDCLSPYFEQFKVTDFLDDGRGGKFGERVLGSVKYRRTQEVIILFGGKGCGKSTFIRKLLYLEPPNPIKHFAQIAIIDLLKMPEERNLIHAKIWTDLIDLIDKDKLLENSREELTKLFHDRFQLAEKQDLYGLTLSSTEYNLALNKLVSEWKQDKIYCAKQICTYWKRKQKGIIIVIDNTDQFSSEIQDFCFTTAQQIAKELDCLVIISMREERFHASKIGGTLDAFQNVGFHLSSPLPQKVFEKRLNYISDVLGGDGRAAGLMENMTPEKIGDLRKLLQVVLREFRKEASPLNNFLRACTHGDTRLALDLFRQFLVSGYTNIDEMISKPHWTIQTHQVLKPMMIPYRFFYDEAHSNIPNIYQIRSKVKGSHFTALRILSDLAKGHDTFAPPYVSVSQLRNYFADSFNMVDDCEKNLDILLRFGVIEANNRIDEFNEKVDSVKITTYGLYFLNEMSLLFTYIELICIDCGVFVERLANHLIKCSNEELELFLHKKRYERVIKRMEKAEEFIEYLCQEEEREIQTYSIGSSQPVFSKRLKQHFAIEKPAVLQSAQRNTN